VREEIPRGGSYRKMSKGEQLRALGAADYLRPDGQTDEVEREVWDDLGG